MAPRFGCVCIGLSCYLGVLDQPTLALSSVHIE